MSATQFRWRGSCPYRSVQTDLVAWLERCARHMESRNAERSSKRPMWIKPIFFPSPGTCPPLPLVRNWRQELTGRIVVSPRLAMEEERHEWLIAGARAGIVRGRPEGRVEDAWFELSRLRVDGIDFQLPDPWDMYPGGDRISFVFLRAAEAPFLDGRIAELFPGSDDGGPWGVDAPGIFRRFLHIEWMELFLAAIQEFFVPDLEATRDGESLDLPARDGVLDRMARTPKGKRSPEDTIRALLDAHDAESAPSDPSSR